MPEYPTLFAVFEERKAWEEAHFDLAKAGLGRFLEDEESTAVVMGEIEASGITVKAWPYSKHNLRELLDALRANSRSMLWNLTDGHDVFRGSYFPAFVRLAGIPHIGSGSYAQMLCQNKHHLKAVAESIGVPAVRGQLFNQYSRRPLELPQILQPPFFVKPACLDNSIGDNVVAPICEDATSALNAIETLFSIGISEVLVEEYLAGDEFSFVALNGGEWVSDCPQLHHGGPGYFSSQAKDSCNYSYTYPETAITTEILAAGRRLAHALRLQDYYRADFRVGTDNRPRLLEINTSPFLVSRIFDSVAQRHFSGRSEMFRRMICQSYERQQS